MTNNNIFLENYKERSIFDSNCIEFWTPITGRSCPNVIENRYYISTFGNTWNNNTKRPIGLSMNTKGYHQFSLMCEDRKSQVCRKLHRVLMIEFCYFPGCENYEVNHIDGVKTNNNIYNLEWVTHSENTIHAINTGLKTVFGNETSVLLTDEDIVKILHLYNDEHLSVREIIRRMNIRGLEYALVNNIVHGKARLSYYNNLYGKF